MPDNVIFITGLIPLNPQVVAAILVSVCYARPAIDAALEEVDNDDLQTAQQFYSYGFPGYGGHGYYGGYGHHGHRK